MRIRGEEEKRRGDDRRREGRWRGRRGREKEEKRGGGEEVKEAASDQHPPSPQRYVVGVMLGCRSRRAFRGSEEVDSAEDLPARAVLAPVPRNPTGHRATDGMWAGHPGNNGHGIPLVWSVLVSPRRVTRVSFGVSIVAHSVPCRQPGPPPDSEATFGNDGCGGGREGETKSSETVRPPR